MRYCVPTNIPYEKIKNTSREELETYLEEHFPIYIPDCIETVDDVREANSLLARYASYKIYLTPIYLRIRAEKRRSAKNSELLSKEELFQAYATGAETAYEIIWRMLKTRSAILDECRYL